MRVIGKKSDLPAGLMVGLTDQLRIDPAVAQLGQWLSTAINGAIKLSFVLAKHMRRRGG